MDLKIRYLPGAHHLYFNSDIGDWIDLYTCGNTSLKAGESALISLGIAIDLPAGFEANIVPRSSTFKKYGIIQTNSYGG